MQKTILVVDDEQDIQDALKDKFTAEGFRVLTAGDGNAGLDIALREHPDLILLDILMPKADGWSMLDQLRKDVWGIDVPVILLTALDNMESTLQAMEYKSYDVLVKNNWTIADVVKRVKERLNIADAG